VNEAFSENQWRAAIFFFMFKRAKKKINGAARGTSCSRSEIYYCCQQLY